MQVIRKIVDREQMFQFNIPAYYGTKVEVIILPLPDQALNHLPDSRAKLKLHEETGYNKELLTAPAEDASHGEHERFVASCYDAVIKDDAREDDIWSKYL